MNEIIADKKQVVLFACSLLSESHHQIIVNETLFHDTQESERKE